MKEFAKYLSDCNAHWGCRVGGTLLRGSTTNTSLIIGMLMVLEGTLGHIFVNNMKKGSVASNIVWAIILLLVPYVIFLFFKKKAYTEEELAAYNY